MIGGLLCCVNCSPDDTPWDGGQSFFISIGFLIFISFLHTIRRYISFLCKVNVFMWIYIMLWSFIVSCADASMIKMVQN